MICLRCGHCCIHYDVMIIDKPELGIAKGNVKHKPFGEKCQHLRGDVPGEYSCAVHHEPWFSETPCHGFGQFESYVNDPCRMGVYQLQCQLRLENHD